MTPGTGILSQLLDQFILAIVPGYDRILPDARSLLSILATLEIALAGLWWALDGGNRIEAAFLKKVMQIGFFVWVVNNYKWLAMVVLKGFVYTGTTVGGGTNPESLIEDPSQIIEYGFAVTAPIFAHTQSYSLITVSIRHAMDMLLTQFAAVLILIAFFGIALLVFITYLEFYIISALGLILVPFGVFKHTAFLSEKVFGAVIAFGIRLMVLAFILSLTQNTLSTLSLPPEPGLQKIMLVLFTALTILGLSWHAPAVASALLAGSPGLGVGAVVGTGLAVAGGVAAAGSMVNSAARQTAQLGREATALAARGGSDKASQLSSGGREGGGESGGGGGGQAVASTTPSVGSSIASSGGSCTAPAPPAWAQDLSQKQHSSSDASPHSSSGPSWAQRLMMARGTLPHDTQSGGGISVPLTRA